MGKSICKVCKGLTDNKQMVWAMDVTHGTCFPCFVEFRKFVKTKHIKPFDVTTKYFKTLYALTVSG